jgi:hypothetical protein
MDFLPFAKLSDQSVAPRVRNLLEGAYECGAQPLEATFKRCLDEFENELFKQADRSTSNQTQQLNLEAIKEIKRKRAASETVFKNSLQNSMIGLLLPRKQAKAPAKKSKGGNLSLIEHGDLEETLAQNELSARAEIRYSQVLHGLGIRFAVIGGGAPLQNEGIPLGPHAVYEAAAEAARQFDISPKMRVALLRQFEKILLAGYGSLLDSINDYLIDHRVFAHLQSGTAKRGNAASSDDADDSAAKEDAKAEAKPEPDKKVASPSRPSAALPGARPPTPMAAGPTPSQNRAASNQPMAAGMPTFSETNFPDDNQWNPTPQGIDFNFPAIQPPSSSGSPPGGMPGAVTGNAQHGSSSTKQNTLGAGRFSDNATQQVANSGARRRQELDRAANELEQSQANDNQAQDAELFTTLRELLAGRRTQTGGSSKSGASEPGVGRSVQTADVQSVLTVLQNQPVQPVNVGGQWVSRRISHIKQDLMSGLKPIAGVQNPRLQAEDSDTIDLVGMLFDHLMQEVKPASTSHNLLSKLQVPLLKVALADKAFFTRRSHPARQLLNAIAETSLFWLEEEDADQALVGKMQLVVDNVVSEFDNDISIFSNLLGDLSKHITTLQKKADVSEKRNVEAAKGREKLELARELAAKAVAERLADKRVPGPLCVFLEEAWADVLALTSLREGEFSATFRERLACVDQVVRCFDESLGARSKDAFQGLKDSFAQGLDMVGFHQSEFSETWDSLATLIPENKAEPARAEAAVQQIHAAVQAKSRVGSDVAPESKTTGTILENLKKQERIPLSKQENTMLERIKQLPFGTWFEFVTNQQGETVRRKLSWFSTLTGRCLFVNARGSKAGEKTLDQLARDLVRGNAKVVEEIKEGIVDRAWKSIMATLKSVTGGGKPAPDSDVAIIGV